MKQISGLDLVLAHAAGSSKSAASSVTFEISVTSIVVVINLTLL